MLDKTVTKTKSKECVIEIFGIGYVGFPLTIRLANSGFHVIGIDTDVEKIKRYENQKLLGTEIVLSEKLKKSINEKTIEFKTDSLEFSNPKIGMICVPTPIASEDMDSDFYVEKAVKSFLNTSKKGDVIILESSIQAGTTEKIRGIIELHGYTVGDDFGLCFCPERIDPLNKKWKLENIPRIIYCSDDYSFEISKIIYQYINNSQLTRVSSSLVAEMVKSFENAFRLVNISLVNELAVLCGKLNVDVNEIISAASTKPFGFTPFYPGPGVGGHCIPKDPRFLLESAEKTGFEFKTIQSALDANLALPKFIVENIENHLDELKAEKSIIVCGLAYKPDIEDMRDSPGFKLIKEFSRKGFHVLAYDPFYRPELESKYRIENDLKEPFEIIEKLDDDSIKNTSCICIVQNHTIDRDRLQEIYDNGVVKLIYDCRQDIIKNDKSDTQIRYLGGNSATTK